MALVCLCDGGCGKSGDPSAFVTLGTVIQRQYCEACAVRAGEFIAERDAAHDAAATAWRTDLAAAVARFTDMKLPDVADAGAAP